MKVELQKIIDALYEVNDDNALYLDTEAGEIVHVYDGGVYGGGEGVEDMLMRVSVSSFSLLPLTSTTGR